MKLNDSPNLEPKWLIDKYLYINKQTHTHDILVEIGQVCDVQSALPDSMVFSLAKSKYLGVKSQSKKN